MKTRNKRCCGCHLVTKETRKSISIFLQSNNYVEIVSKQSEQRRWYCQLSPFNWILDQNFVCSSNFCSNCSDSVLLSFSFLYSLLSLMFAYDSFWQGLPFCSKSNLIASNNINSFFYLSASSSWANSFPVFGWKSNAKCTPCLMETLSIR